MKKVKVKISSYFKDRWYLKGEIIEIDNETYNAIGSDAFEVIETEEVKEEAKPKEKISNKTLNKKDIETK